MASKIERPSSRASSRSNNPAAALAAQMDDGKTHILLGCSGSVATIKLPNILHAFSRFPRLSVRVILTASASKFLVGQSAEQPTLLQLRRIPNVDAIYRDEDEWSPPWVRSASILHIELRRSVHEIPLFVSPGLLDTLPVLRTYSYVPMPNYRADWRGRRWAHLLVIAPLSANTLAKISNGNCDNL